MPQVNTIFVQKVKIIPISSEIGDDYSYNQCGFCQKLVPPTLQFIKACNKLSGDNFYCPFCLRHGFNCQKNENILRLTFRAVIGYYYQEMYKNPQHRKLWGSQIKDYIQLHEKAGLNNPAFSYDPETYIWFLDFGKIGRNGVGKKEIDKTILNILFCFDLQGNVPHIQEHKVFEKYQIPIRNFVANRQEISGKHLLAPTLAGCGFQESKKVNFDETRSFRPGDLII